MIDIISELINTLQELAPRYDFDVSTPGNGFRSLICIVDIVIFHLISLLRSCSEKRYMLMFRSSYYCKEIEAYAAVLRFFVLSLQQVVSTTNELAENSLFPPLNDDYSKHKKLLKGIEALDASCFYGRALGFQVTQEADIDFCKGFWNLSEFGNHVPRFFCPNMAVNDESVIPIDELVTLESVSGERLVISPPNAHTGARPVRVRIMSYSHRRDLKASSGASDRQPASPYLLLHCHGGGFVATSSKSHETYLRSWAKSLDCTIVSVDYSLAPEDPFPRPTEEVLYAYAYIINNPNKFGWTGGKICLVGDSAGGNLVTSVSIRLIQLGVKRRPDGLMLIYTPFLFQFLPSPSRLLSFFDPLLHMGVVLRCTAAYTRGYASEVAPTELPNRENVRHKSLQEYVDEVQKVQSNRIFNLEDSSILSLVNLSQNGCNEARHSKSGFSKAKDDKLSEREQQESSGEEEEDVVEHEASISGIEVMSDTHRIMLHLPSSICDRRLLDYLKDHPITKDSLIPIDELENDLPKDPKVPPNSNKDSNPTLSTKSSSSAELNSPATAVESKEMRPTAATSTVVPCRTLVASISSQSLAAASRQMMNVRTLSHSLADTAVTAAGHAMDNLSGWLDTSAPAGKADKAKLSRVASLTPEVAAKLQQAEAQKTMKYSYIDKLTESEVPKDPLISPMYASSEILRQLPPMRFLACHLDPLLDDTISFAVRARACGSTISSIDLVDSLPHGFLNFSLISPECREGSKLCLRRIKEQFGMTDMTLF
ncbi:unnamed protein product [Enterobius vermicularis]|uniref:Hormone-sensitive lipase n=1 Tax=Enterobius vermicularis TaxID=51028 RepID=A0A0N4VJH3_ENTVE|nr:unnamed protein product [Enterobius vermicularis]